MRDFVALLRLIGDVLIERRGRFLRIVVSALTVHGVDHGQVGCAESGEGVGEHGTQFAHTLRDLRFAGLQVGDALLHAVELGLGRFTAFVDLFVGVLGSLLDDACGLGIGRVPPVGSVRIGLFAGILRLGDQLIGLLLGGFTTFGQIGQQLIDLLGGLILLGGDVGANLLDLGVHLAHGPGAVHFGLIGDLLRLGLGGVRDFRRTTLRIGHHLGNLLAHIGELLVGIGQRGLDLIVGLAFESGDLLIGAFALCGDLLGGFRAHIGNLTLLGGTFGGQTLIMLLAGIRQLQINGLTLCRYGLLRFAA